MDASVRAAMEKWPHVPAVHGWLLLDRHGRWHLRGEPITHPGLVAFINRNYAHDEAGRWFFQNGPQRGYVQLEYTPWVLHVDGPGRLYTHTGHRVQSVAGAWLDEDGELLLETDRGIALVASDALPRVSEWLLGRDARPADADLLEPRPDQRPGEDTGVVLAFGDTQVALGRIARAQVPARFGFVADPQPGADAGP